MKKLYNLYYKIHLFCSISFAILACVYAFKEGFGSALLMAILSIFNYLIAEKNKEVRDFYKVI